MKEERKFTPLQLLWRGASMGIAEAIPGISSATIALITNLYTSLVKYIDDWSVWVGRLVRTRSWVPTPDLVFAFSLGAGMVASLILSAIAMSELIETWEAATLIGISVLVLIAVFPTTSQLFASQPNWRTAAWTVIGIALGFAVTSLNDQQLPITHLWLFLAGIIASCALVLPGISGSFMLLTLGFYKPVLEAVGSVNLDVLLPLGCGVAIGVLLTARLMTKLLSAAPVATGAVCCGLIYGALPNIVPDIPLSALGNDHLIGAGVGALLGMLLILAAKSEK